MSRVFTIEEVDALIPELSRLVGKQIELKALIEDLLGELLDQTGEIPESLEIAESETERCSTLKRRLSDLVATYNEGWGRVQALGAIVKDPQLGLLDFYGRIDGRLVWLCWRPGETRLSYFHELHTGFSGRQELRTETRTHSMN